MYVSRNWSHNPPSELCIRPYNSKFYTLYIVYPIPYIPNLRILFNMKSGKLIISQKKKKKEGDVTWNNEMKNEQNNNTSEGIKSYKIMANTYYETQITGKFYKK